MNVADGCGAGLCEIITEMPALVLCSVLLIILCVDTFPGFLTYATYNICMFQLLGMDQEK